MIDNLKQQLKATNKRKNKTMEQILNLAEEYGIGIETESSHSGIFYEELDGTVCEIEISDLFFES